MNSQQQLILQQQQQILQLQQQLAQQQIANQQKQIDELKIKVSQNSNKKDVYHEPELYVMTDYNGGEWLGTVLAQPPPMYEYPTRGVFPVVGVLQFGHY